MTKNALHWALKDIIFLFKLQIVLYVNDAGVFSHRVESIIFYADSERRVVKFSDCQCVTLTLWQLVFSCECLSEQCVPGWWAHGERTVSPGAVSPHGAEPFKWLTGASQPSSRYREQHLMYLITLRDKIIPQKPNVWKKNLPGAQPHGLECWGNSQRSTRGNQSPETWATVTPVPQLWQPPCCWRQ